LLKELAHIERIDDNDDDNLTDGEESDEEEEDEDWTDEDEEKLDNLGTNLLNNIELIGKSIWDNSPEFRDKTREIATELLLKFTQGSYGDSRKLPIYKSQPHKDGEFFDLDVDSTVDNYLDNLDQGIVPWTYRKITTSNPVILLIDTSFSMNGEKIMIAGLCVSILSRLIPSKDLTIMGFANEPFFIKKYSDEISPHHLITRILRLTPRGYTNLANAIKKGSELVFPHYHHSKLILLTDADPTTGKNPIPEASKLPILDLLLFPRGNEWLGKRLVFEVPNGKLYKINKISDVVNSINKIFKLH